MALNTGDNGRMQKRKPEQARKRLASDGWNRDIKTMPTKGRFEVLRVYPDVFLHLPGESYVIEPQSGRMFVPAAWRPARRGSNQ